MSYPTYKDLVINVLLRMGEDKNISGTTITDTTTILGYKKAIPTLLNEALNYLATAGKYIVTLLSITKTTDVVERFELATLATNFYSLNGQVLLDDQPTSAYRLEGKSTLALWDAGTWRVYYNSYPQSVTGITDSTSLVLDPEVYAIIPLYIEGKLRQINDEDYSMSILNEFEGRRNELMGKNKSHASVEYDENTEAMEAFA